MKAKGSDFCDNTENKRRRCCRNEKITPLRREPFLRALCGLGYQTALRKMRQGRHHSEDKSRKNDKKHHSEGIKTQNSKIFNQFTENITCKMHVNVVL